LPKAIEDECEHIRRESYGGKQDEMIEYRRDIQRHPERYVKVGDIFAEATANVARKKGQAA
jgi:hypothetical protein